MKKLLLVFTLFSFSLVYSASQEEKKINLEEDSLIIQNSSTRFNLHVHLMNEDKSDIRKYIVGKKKEIQISKKELQKFDQVYFHSYWFSPSDATGKIIGVEILLSMQQAVINYTGENSDLPYLVLK